MCRQVPEGFSQPCMEALLFYMYHDVLPDGLEPPAVVELLHAASYYGTSRWESLTCSQGWARADLLTGLCCFSLL